MIKKSFDSLVRWRLLKENLIGNKQSENQGYQKLTKNKNNFLYVKSWNKTKLKQKIFIDEMKIEVDNKKNRIQIRRMSSEKYNEKYIIKQTMQRSVSIGIWCCMSYYDLETFSIFYLRLNSHRIVDILRDNLLPSIDMLRQEEAFIFKKDNAPCNRAKLVKNGSKSKILKCYLGVGSIERLLNRSQMH